MKGVWCRGGGYSANERREIGSKVRGKYRMVMDWYRSGNEVVSRKKAERKGFNNTFTFPLISRMNTDNKDNKEDQCKSVKSVGITIISGNNKKNARTIAYVRTSS